MTGREGCRAREDGRELEIWRGRSSQMDRGEATSLEGDRLMADESGGEERRSSP